MEAEGSSFQGWGLGDRFSSVRYTAPFNAFCVRTITQAMKIVLRALLPGAVPAVEAGKPCMDLGVQLAWPLGRTQGGEHRRAGPAPQTPPEAGSRGLLGSVFSSSVHVLLGFWATKGLPLAEVTATWGRLRLCPRPHKVPVAPLWWPCSLPPPCTAHPSAPPWPLPPDPAGRTG